MLKYKHILLAIDFYEGSDYVAKKAYELAKQMGAKLSIVHVVEMVYGYGYPFAGSVDLEEQLAIEAKKNLNKLADELSIGEHDRYTEIGVSKIEIDRVAEEVGADLIVLGSHGRHGIGLLLGSTANAVVNSALCDVLTVRIQE
jgi:universal stress protein A